jgi:type IV pilus biogenesis protein PilP
MKIKIYPLTLFVLLSFVLLNAHAEEVAPPADRQVHAEEPRPDNYAEMDKLRSQNAILVETLKNKKLRQEIADIDNPKEAKSAMPAMPQQMSIMQRQVSEPAAPRTPQVKLISGVEGGLTALILLPSGGTMTARVGTHIPGAGVVKSITENEVTVSGSDGPVSLPFESGETAAADHPQTGSYNLLPMGSPGGR